MIGAPAHGSRSDRLAELEAENAIIRGVVAERSADCDRLAAQLAAVNADHDFIAAAEFALSAIAKAVGR
jgi:hypothetical protein